MSRLIHVAALQLAFAKGDAAANIAKVADHVRLAAGRGAEIILPSELFCDHYFCKTQDEAHFANAFGWREHPAVKVMQSLAAELGVVLHGFQTRWHIEPHVQTATIYAAGLPVPIAPICFATDPRKAGHP